MESSYVSQHIVSFGLSKSCAGNVSYNTLLLLLSHISHVQLCVTPQTEPTRLPQPWDSPGKNTGVGCHFLLQCMRVKRESEVAQSYPTPGDAMDCSPPGSSVHGSFQARVLEWVAIAFSDITLQDMLIQEHCISDLVSNLRF